MFYDEYRWLYSEIVRYETVLLHKLLFTVDMLIFFEFSSEFWMFL